MTSLKTLVDTEWKKITDAEAAAAGQPQTGTARFNFYTSLKNMVQTVKNTLPNDFLFPFWNQQQNNNQNTSTYALFTRNLRKA